MGIINKKNHKGFTLVEIIVSIAIFTAVLAVLGSIMVAGFKYFYETSNTDLNKQATDELMSYVRGELLYATDVRVQSSIIEKPEGNWYSFTIEEGLLKHYEEKQGQSKTDLKPFNNKSFYNNNDLKLYVKGYENNNRLDLRMVLYNDNEDLYTTKDTLELLNLKSLESAPFSSEMLVNGDELKIYYKKDKTLINNNENSYDLSGTVYDEIYNINKTNNRGYYIKDVSYNYKYGECVYYNGYWWKRMKNDNNKVPGSDNQCWKRLSMEYTHTDLGEGVSGSNYEPGDIVIYNGHYWQANENTENGKDKFDSGWSPSIVKNSSYWTNLGEINNETVINIVKQKKYETVNFEIKVTVVNKIPDYINIWETNPNNVNLYEDIDYQVGDVVKVPYKENYYRKYIKVKDMGKKAPGNADSGWQLLEYRWDINSTYLKDDIVMIMLPSIGKEDTEEYASTHSVLVKCIKDVVKKIDATKDYNYPAEFWKLIG